MEIKFQRVGSPAARGKWGKRFRGSRQSRGWSVLGKRGTVVVYRRRTGAGGSAPRNGGGASLAGGQESDGKWLHSFHVMMWCWWCACPGLRGDGAAGRRQGRAAAEARAHRRSGPGDLVRENEIGQVCELQWVAAVLLEHWIGGGNRQRRVLTVSRGSGGAPARCGARGREKQWKCKRVMARVSS
jgi:hypothetical protein